MIKYLKQQLDYENQNPVALTNLGVQYKLQYQYDRAIPEFEKALEIYKKWGTKPYWVYNYTHLAHSYHKAGMYKKEKKLYKKAEQDFPNHPALFLFHSILSLTEGDTVTANDYIRKLIVHYKENSYSETVITDQIGAIHSDAGILDKAEEYYRQALSFDPENPVMLNELGYFLINKDRNINEGLELVERALKSEPDNYSYLDTKGWGLYKQGKNKEALELLEKCDSLKPVYDHELFLHLEAARKAVAGQKNQ